MRNRTNAIIATIFAGMFATAGTVFAAETVATTEPVTEPWYQIEVLIYEPVEQIIAGEAWPAIITEELTATAISLTPLVEAGKPTSKHVEAFHQLPPESLNLAETAAKLVEAGRYRIITFQGWQQPVRQRHEADVVRITDLLPETDLVENKPSVSPQGEIILNPPQPTPLQSVEDPLEEATPLSEDDRARINGTVTVSLSRYLHMALDMRYYNPEVYLAEQIALQKPDELVIDTFVMKQSRRMRSKEVHVFDHPYFGVIATITPVETTVP